MSRLIVPPGPPDQDGSVLRITPASAGWAYVGFEVCRLAKGQVLVRETGDQELCAVVLSGRANARTGGSFFKEIGLRASVFEHVPPFSVYVPSNDQIEIDALTELEVALCTAPGKGDFAARLIHPEQVAVEVRGSGHMERRVHHILPESEPAGSLLVVEVLTPSGHWSSYPPHKHDEDRLPQESYLEETYYHKVQPDHGFVVQRVYTDDLSLNETMAVKDGQAVLVPKGYHPVSAPPGYDSYYLNVMAGPVRTWKFKNDPDHEWLFAQFPNKEK